MQTEQPTAPAAASTAGILDSVPTEDLMTALAARFGHVALIGATYNAGGGLDSYSFRWSGNRHLVMGLCDDLRDRVQSDTVVFIRRAMEAGQPQCSPMNAVTPEAA